MIETINRQTVIKRGQTGHCRDCRFWERTSPVGDMLPYGTCTMLIETQHVTDDSMAGMAIMWKPDPDDLAAMMTGEDFGCLLWRGKG